MSHNLVGKIKPKFLLTRIYVICSNYQLPRVVIPRLDPGIYKDAKKNAWSRASKLQNYMLPKP